MIEVDWPEKAAFVAGLTRAAAAFGTWADILAPAIERLTAALSFSVDDGADLDQSPEGCWATSRDDEDEACDRPAVDELGLCDHHRLAMVD